MRRGFAGMLVVAGLATLALPAHALAAESLAVTGSITYTWQGDPARGCAAAGVCDVSGALIVQAQGTGEVVSLGPREQVLNLDNGTTTVRVLTGTGSTATECLDVPPSAGGPGLFVTRGRGGRPRAGFNPPLSSGRCAGPTAADLGRFSLPVRKRGGKLPSFDLRTSRAFMAGPFSGRLVSTVRARPSGKQVLGEIFSQGSGSGGPPRRKVLVERVALRYRVQLVQSGLGVSFAGTGDPSCTALGSCGTRGTLNLSLTGAPRTVTLVASRVVKRRFGAHRAIADLRHGRLGFPFGELASSARVSETLARADGTRCQSGNWARGAAIVFGGGPLPPSDHRSGGDAEFLSDSPESEMWRTYCPGPSDSDIFGPEGTLAQGRATVAQLLRPRTVISLSDPGSFGGYGYDGSRTGALELSLTLVGVRAGTGRESR